MTITKQMIDNSNETYNNLIMEYLINYSETNVNPLITDFINSLKKNVDGELVLTVLRKYNPRCEDKLIIFIVHELLV